MLLPATGEMEGRHYVTGNYVRLRWSRGIIESLTEIRQGSRDGVWIAPELFDLQVNGFAGVDFQRDDLGVDELLYAVREIHRAGCGRFLLTLVTMEWPRMIARLNRLRAMRDESAELQDAIAGWHLEGPFLSSEPGYCGAHNPAWMVDPTPDHIHELRNVTSGDPVLLTLAPERKGAEEAIRLASSLGMRVSLGHTNASSEEIRAAMEAGATGFTHLGNACPQQLDRHDNILWRVLDRSGLTCSLIPDQIHVSPPLFRLIHKLAGGDSILYVSDAMAAAAARPGRYALGDLELDVGEDQIVRQSGQRNYAGSALRPCDGVFRAASMLDRSWREVWDAYSVRPAEFMGMESGLAVGQPSRFCVIRPRDFDASSNVEWVKAGETAQSS